MFRERLNNFVSDDRAVTWTIEAFLSVSLLLAILVMSVQLVPVGTTSSQQANYQQSQLQQDGADVLRGADETGELSKGIRYWNPESEEWHNSLARHNEYATFPGQHPLKTSFGLLDDDNVLYNMDISYQGSYDAGNNDETKTQTVVYQGAPSSNAVVVEYTFILFESNPVISEDGDPLTGSEVNCGGGYGSNEEITLEKLTSSSECNYVMPNAFPEKSTDRYNVVRVELTLWS